jgi:hypothetical protein
MANGRTIILGSKGPGRTASVAALTTATGAVACGVCCVLPFAFPAVAAAGTGGLLAWFGAAHWWATGLAAVVVGGAWIAVGVQSYQARVRPSRATLYAMALATGALLLAIVWPQIEPDLIRMLTKR